MFGIKTRILNRLRKSALQRTSQASFPEKGIPMTYLKIRLHGVLSVLKKRAISDNIGWLFTPPHALAINTYTSFLGQNPNHIGNWSTDESIKWGSTLLEFEVIQKLAHLYKIPLSKIEARTPEQSPALGYRTELRSRGR